MINHPGSSVTIGRSGSGKTTCMLFRVSRGREQCSEGGTALNRSRSQILGTENHFALTPSPLLPPSARRQLFITQSPVLAGRVKKAYDALTRTQARSALSKAELRELVSQGSAFEDEADLIDVEQGQADRRGLPAKWGQLEDHHFPLFLSYDTLLDLLEAELGIKHRATRGKRHERQISKYKAAGPTIDPFALNDGVSATPEPRWMYEVDGQLFTTSLWESFDERLRKGVDPSLAWSEILGVVKGSSQVADTPRVSLVSLTRRRIRKLTHVLTGLSRRGDLLRAQRANRSRLRRFEEGALRSRTGVLRQEGRTGHV